MKRILSLVLSLLILSAANLHSQTRKTSMMKNVSVFNVSVPVCLFFLGHFLQIYDYLVVTSICASLYSRCSSSIQKGCTCGLYFAICAMLVRDKVVKSFYFRCSFLFDVSYITRFLNKITRCPMPSH